MTRFHFVLMFAALLFAFALPSEAEACHSGGGHGHHGHGHGHGHYSHGHGHGYGHCSHGHGHHGHCGCDDACDTDDGNVIEQPPAEVPGDGVCPGDFVVAKFVATSADYNGLASIYMDPDTRGGSVTAEFNGVEGLSNATSDDPYSGGILTLRNGGGKMLEQWQINRNWPPSSLDDDGCVSWADADAGDLYQCWLNEPEDLVGGMLGAAVPTMVTSSNQGFDVSGERVEISASIDFDFGAGVPEDNSHETLTITWFAPLGFDNLQANLRMTYDGALATDMTYDGEFVELVAVYGMDDATFAPIVDVLVFTETTLTVTMNVNDALIYICDGGDDPDPEPEPVCEDGAKIQTLTWTYVGEDCSASDHSQDPSVATCAGDPALAEPVRIIAANKDNPFHRRAKIYYDGVLGLGDTFVASALAAGNDRFLGDLRLFVLDADDNILQVNKLHVSCSQPLFTGDQFGAFVLNAFTLR